MTTQDLTREELLQMLPKMDLRNDSRANDGRPIEARRGASQVLEYERVITTTTDPNLLGQTFAVGFNTRRLIDWLEQNSNNMDMVQVYLSIDEEGRFNVIFWPYNAGLPSVIHEGKQSGATLSSPYNIGGRRP